MLPPNHMITRNETTTNTVTKSYDYKKRDHIQRCHQSIQLQETRPHSTLSPNHMITRNDTTSNAATKAECTFAKQDVTMATRVSCDLKWSFWNMLCKTCDVPGQRSERIDKIILFLQGLSLADLEKETISENFHFYQTSYIAKITYSFQQTARCINGVTCADLKQLLVIDRKKWENYIEQKGWSTYEWIQLPFLDQLFLTSGP